MRGGYPTEFEANLGRQVMIKALMPVTTSKLVNERREYLNINRICLTWVLDWSGGKREIRRADQN